MPGRFFILLIQWSLCIPLFSQVNTDSVWLKINSFQEPEECYNYIQNEADKIFYYANPQDMLKLAEKTREIGIQLHRKDILAAALNYESLYEQSQQHFNTQIELNKKALNIIRNSDPSKLLAQTYNHISIAYYEKGEPGNQLLYNDSAIYIAGFLDDPSIKQTMVFNRSYVLKDLGRPRETLETLFGLIKELDPDKDAGLRGMALLNVSYVYNEEEQLDSALFFAKESYAQFQNSLDETNKTRSLLQLGYMYVLSDSLSKALPLLLESKQSFEKLNDQGGIIWTQMRLAKLYYKSNDYSRAEKSIQKAIQLNDESDNKMNIPALYFQYSEILEAQGRFNEALKQYKIYDAYHDSINGQKTQKRLSELEIKFQVAEREKENKLLKKNNEILENQKEIRRQREIVVYTLTAGFVLILIFLLVVLRLRHIAIKRDKARLQAEVALKQERVGKMEQELQQKSQQLTSKAIHLSERQQLLESILEKTRNTEKTEFISDLQKTIRLNMHNDKQWEEFTTYFEEINVGFFDRARERYPDITEKELRLLALIKLGLTIKEVANLMHIEPNSVKTARYRLKKKLQNNPEDSLEKIVNTL